MNRNRVLTFCLLLFSVVLLPADAIAPMQSLTGKGGTDETRVLSGETDKKKDVGPRGSIAGRVVDWQGNPIPGALVHVQERPFLIQGMILSDSMPEVVTADEKDPVETDLDGMFVIDDLEPGHYTIIVEAFGFPPLAQPGVPVIENRRMELRLVLRPLGSLTAKRVKFVDETPSEKKREECSKNPEKCN